MFNGKRAETGQLTLDGLFRAFRGTDGTGSHRCACPRIASFYKAEPFDRQTSAPTARGACRASERTSDSVKGIASLPLSMRPHGHRVQPLRCCNVCRACPASPFSRLRADGPAPMVAWVPLLIGGSGSERKA